MPSCLSQATVTSGWTSESRHRIQVSRKMVFERFRAPSVQEVTRLIFVLAFLVLFLGPFAHSQEPEMKDMPGMSMNAASTPNNPSDAAKRLADKRESEFNHHLAGFFVIVAGLFILSEGQLERYWPGVCYAWPTCFLVAGLFVLFYSDTEMWPFGPQNPWYAVTHNVEDLQHKVFAVVLLALGYIELQRSRGRLKARWAAWCFPMMAVAGAILLLFHVHSGDMHAPGAMEAMGHIQKQHRWFAFAGFGIGIARGLAETPQIWQQSFKRVWPTLLMVLGGLLMAYKE